MGTVAELDLSREERGGGGGEEDIYDDKNKPSTSFNNSASKYPTSIVWCAIPILTDVFPLVGHVGVTNSEGWIYDFIGDGTVHQSASNNLSFNRVMRVIPLHENKCKQPLNESLSRVMTHYTRRNEKYNLFGQNCHDFVGVVLNLSEYDGKDDWNLIDVALFVWGLRGNGGSFVDANAAYRTFGPVCAAFVAAFAFGVGGAFVRAVLGLYGAIAGYFALYVFVLSRRRSCSIRAGSIPFLRNSNNKNKNDDDDI